MKGKVLAQADTLTAVSDANSLLMEAGGEVRRATVATLRKELTKGIDLTELKELADALNAAVEGLGMMAEGYVRVSGSSDPALSYATYKPKDAATGAFSEASALSLFYPCLVGTASSGDAAQVGRVLHVLDKLRYDDGTGHALDTAGNPHRIDGSEGDVMIVNIEPYYRLAGKYQVGGQTYDAFLVARTPFTWQGHEAERVERFGWSPDRCVAHQDADGKTRMHSAYNPEWQGSLTPQRGCSGRYNYTQASPGAALTETFDASGTLMQGAGGCHTANLTLPQGEQYARNLNADAEATVPWYNQTADGAAALMALILAEGGTFDAHKAALMGSGFSSNDVVNAAAFEAAGSEARNGLRYETAAGGGDYHNFNGENTFQLGSGVYPAQMINDWRSPFKVMEAHRALSHALRTGVGELEWFAFEGNKYKWRSVPGFAGPREGEMTAVLFKVLSAQFTADAKDPTTGTALTGKRVDFMVTEALFHGMVTSVSPSWWTSGLIFTQDADGTYDAYLQRDQAALLPSPTADIDEGQTYPFEAAYPKVGERYTKAEGYARDYLSGPALMLPASDAMKSGGGLHTYVGKYNWFTATAPAAGKRSVRGFRRGINAAGVLSPLTLNANYAPSYANSSLGFGTCCRIS